MENQILLEKVGNTKNKKLIDDCYKIYKEKLFKQYPEYFETNHSKMVSLVTTTENFEIKSIGMSCLNDLLTDNWGKFLNGFMGGITSVNLKIISGLDKDFLMWGSGSTWNNRQAGAVGSLIQVGSGTVTATRQDFALANFVASLSSGVGGWNSGLGKIDIPANAIATSSFTISETGLFGVWVHSPAPAVDNVLLSRDNISPVVNVISAQSINVDYQMLLN